MVKTREEYLEVCKICVKREFNMKKGAICSLTNMLAAYTTDDCPNYVLDEEAAREQKNTVFAKAQDYKGSIIAGFASITLGLIIIIIGLFFGVLFTWAFALIVGGLILLVQTRISKRKQSARLRSKKDSTSSEIIDDPLD